MTALEQLRSWAVFAIFPTDESQREKYVSFVEQRYNCVIQPLRQFVDILNRNEVKSDHMTEPNHVTSTTSADSSSRRSANFTTGLSPDISIQRGNRFKNSIESPRLGYPQKVAPLRHSNEENDIEIEDMETAQEYEIRPKHGSEKASQNTESSPCLRDQIHAISLQYSEEGTNIRNSVFEQLQECKEHTEILFKWGKASLSSLREILDEALADELYFMVRGKTTRILSTISIFEETADKIEKQLSIHFVGSHHSGSASERGTASTKTTPVVTSKSNVLPEQRRRPVTNGHRRNKSETVNGGAIINERKPLNSDQGIPSSAPSTNHVSPLQRMRERHRNDVTAKPQINRCLNKVAQPQQVPSKPYKNSSKYPGRDNFGQKPSKTSSTGPGEIVRVSSVDGATDNRLEFDMYDLDLRIDIPQRESPTGSEGNELEDLLLSWSMNSGANGSESPTSGKFGQKSNSAAGGKNKTSAAAAANSRKTQQQQQPLPGDSKFFSTTSPDFNDRQSDVSSCTPRSNSTPEPPVSPRPRALVKHPKIMKDKLHSMALPSKFPGMGANRFSASW